jgi:hypothetical protein
MNDRSFIYGTNELRRKLIMLLIKKKFAASRKRRSREMCTHKQPNENVWFNFIWLIYDSDVSAIVCGAFLLSLSFSFGGKEYVVVATMSRTRKVFTVFSSLLSADSLHANDAESLSLSMNVWIRFIHKMPLELGRKSARGRAENMPKRRGKISN